MIVQEIGAYISAALGIMAIVSPSSVEKFTSIQAVGSLGTAEIRATYGGFFLGLAVFALYSGIEVVFLALGAGWLGAATVRATTLVTGAFSPKNLGGVVFESIIGLLCIASIIKGTT